MIKDVLEISKDYAFQKGEIIRIDFSIEGSTRDQIVVECTPDNIDEFEWRYHRPGALVTYHVSDEEYLNIKNIIKNYILEHKLLSIN